MRGRRLLFWVPDEFAIVLLLLGDQRADRADFFSTGFGGAQLLPLQCDPQQLAGNPCLDIRCIRFRERFRWHRNARRVREAYQPSCAFDL